MLAPSPPFSQTLATTLKCCIRRHRKPQHAADLSQEASALRPVLIRQGCNESAAGGGRSCASCALHQALPVQTQGTHPNLLCI